MRLVVGSIVLASRAAIACGADCAPEPVPPGAAPKWSVVLLGQDDQGVYREKCGGVVTAVKPGKIEVATAKHCVGTYRWLVVGASTVAKNLTAPPPEAVYVKPTETRNWKLPQSGDLDLMLLEVQYPPNELPTPAPLPQPFAAPHYTGELAPGDNVNLYVWERGNPESDFEARLLKLSATVTTAAARADARSSFCKPGHTYDFCETKVEGFGISCSGVAIKKGFSGGPVLVSKGGEELLAAVISTGFGTIGEASRVSAPMLQLAANCGFGDWKPKSQCEQRANALKVERPSVVKVVY